MKNIGKKSIEAKKKKAISRNNPELILSGIGGVIYLFFGITLSNPYYYGSSILPALITGVISLVGTGIGVKKKKIGGIVILISIPLSLVLGYTPYLIMYIGFLFSPLFLVSSLCLIIGGILCLKGSGSNIK